MSTTIDTQEKTGFSGTVRRHDGKGWAIWEIKPIPGTEQGEGDEAFRNWDLTYTLVADGKSWNTKYAVYDRFGPEPLLEHLLSYVSRKVMRHLNKN